VTTVIAIGTSENHLLWSNAGQQQGYQPEWVIPGSPVHSGPDQNEIGRQMAPVFWRSTFGLSYDRYRGPRPEQQWFQAFREGCPSCTDVVDGRNGRLYDQLTLLFWGIQAAGPNLTPATIDRGLHAIPARRSEDPAVPAAYFAPGNYSWVKDGVAISWDGTGEEPGGQRGCYRYARDGRRFRAGEWPRGDGDLFRTNRPCQGPAR